jgi:hypothetical protein
MLEADLRAGDADAPSMLDLVADVAPTAEEALVDRQRREAIGAHFEDDPLVHLIFCELQEGGKLKDIRTTCRLTAAEFEAALKRLRRRVAQLYSEKTNGR